MSEYIEREALIQRLENSPLFTNFGVDGCFICDGVIDIIKKQPNVKPAADVVEVVRCKECIHWGGVAFGNVCRRWSAPIAGMKNHTQPNDFCSCGERKTNDKIRKD